MKQIDIKPSWLFTDASGTRVGPELFQVLHAIRNTGSVQRAAKTTGFSYRHVWNLTAKWSRFFSGPLVEFKRGKGAKLTPLGERILWAEERIEATLASHLANLASDLEREIGEALAEARPVAYVHASHDLLLNDLRELFNRKGRAKVDLHFCGSLHALASLCRRTCDIAGFHLPSGIAGAGLLRQYAPYLKPRAQKLIHFATRVQGIIVAPGNPLGIQHVSDLVRGGVRFINRQPGSGTRLLFDELLAHYGIDSTAVAGYRLEEFTHAAVAATIASNLADAGFGIEAAARQYGLQFIPIVNERYFLACYTEALDRPEIASLIEAMRAPEFRALAAAYPGYDASRAGEVINVGDALPDLVKAKSAGRK